MCSGSNEFCSTTAYRREWLEAFAGKLKNKISLEGLILFGSRARQEHLEDSDYDILVISPSFAGLPNLKRLELVDEEWEGENSIEIVALTPEEFGHIDSLVVCDALEEGIPIYQRGIWEQARQEFIRLKKEDVLKHTNYGWEIKPH